MGGFLSKNLIQSVSGFMYIQNWPNEKFEHEKEQKDVNMIEL